MPQLTWLITGCSSGFGQEFVRQILSRGDRVIATARNVEKLDNLKSAGVAVLELDVTHSQSNIDSVIAQAISIHGHIDVLVNNAGFVRAGAWEELQADDFLASYETNVLGPIRVTRSLLPHFRERKTGTMVFISSLSGWVGHPFTGAYASSKFALEGAVESLQQEAAAFGLRTLLMEPGRFRTSLLSEQNLQSTRSQVQGYETISAAVNDGLKGEDSNQPGNPEKFVKLVLDLVRAEGCAYGKEIPFRLPVGTDAVQEIRRKMKETAALMDAWEPIITNTDY